MNINEANDDGNPTGDPLLGDYRTHYNPEAEADDENGIGHYHRQPCEFLGCDEWGEDSTPERREEIAADAVDAVRCGLTHEEYLARWLEQGGDSLGCPVSEDRYAKIIAVLKVSA